MVRATPHREPIFAPDVIIETLVEHKVRFVLVGGRAAQLHGASRPTQDADVVVDFNNDNLGNLWAIQHLREMR